MCDRTRRRKVDRTHPTCSECSTNLEVGVNWTESQRNYNRYTCMPCYSARQQRYENKKPKDVSVREKREREQRRKERRTDAEKALDRKKQYGRYIKRTYGITLNEYDVMLRRQHGRCAICGTDEPGGKGIFNVDHCHKTGAVRELLCAKCNFLLGHAEDSIERLEQAKGYIMRHKSNRSLF